MKLINNIICLSILLNIVNAHAAIITPVIQTEFSKCKENFKVCLIETGEVESYKKKGKVNGKDREGVQGNKWVVSTQ